MSVSVNLLPEFIIAPPGPWLDKPALPLEPIIGVLMAAVAMLAPF